MIQQKIKQIKMQKKQSQDLQKQRRMFLVIALFVATGALGFISFGNIGENLVYYWDPSQVIEAQEQAYGATIRLGGVVKAGTLDWDTEANELILSLPMEKQNSMYMRKEPLLKCFVRGSVWS